MTGNELFRWAVVVGVALSAIAMLVQMIVLMKFFGVARKLQEQLALR